MTMSLEQFRDALTAQGVLSGDEQREFQESLSYSGETYPKSAQDLARLLVQQRKLTKYQAAHIYQNNELPLVFGNYVIQEKIGAGGMGRVYKAHHRRLDRLAAIKLLPPDALRSPDAIQRFQQEVKAAARLTHPNIVITYDADEQDGIHYLVMEYVPGQDLASIVKQDGPLPIDLAIECIGQAAEGLAFAHDRDIIHRDIKPANLLLVRENPKSEEPTIKILDMGLARIASAAGASESDDEGLTRTGQIMGSVDYMSPEQAMDTRAADQRSDVYSLGCTLYVLLTGKIPYYDKTLMKKLMAHRDKPTPDARDARTEVPAAVAQACRRMMAKEPSERPPGMRAVVELMRTCMSPAVALQSDALPPPPRKRQEVSLPPPSPSAPPPTAPPRITDAAPPPAKQRAISAAPTVITNIADPTASPPRKGGSRKPAAPNVLFIGVLAAAAFVVLAVGIMGILLISSWFHAREDAGGADPPNQATQIVAPSDDPPETSTGNQVVLFDGTDLSRWRSRQAGWSIDASRKAMVRGPVGGDIWTGEQYENYMLEFEFMLTPGCNSGVFLHASDMSRPAAEQIEIQISDSPDGDVGTGSCGAIYGVAGPDRAAAFPPDYWNRMKITARGTSLVIELNNERIHSIHLNGFPKFRDRQRGHIGFQDHTGQVWFRNVRLTPLD